MIRSSMICWSVGVLWTVWAVRPEESVEELSSGAEVPAFVRTIEEWNNSFLSAADFFVDAGDAPGKSFGRWSRARSDVNGPGVPGSVNVLLVDGGEDLERRFM